MKHVLAGGLAAALALYSKDSEAVRIVDIKGPKRRTLPARKDTRFIILHSTEADGTSALNSLSRAGKANYMVDTNGKVYRITGENQASVGCGRSIWNGLGNLDNHAINIEVVGYHNLPPTSQQCESLRYLLGKLQKQYKIIDMNVMSHSQVAYGRPNKW